VIGKPIPARDAMVESIGRKMGGNPAPEIGIVYPENRHL
jgi:hypothetical protein